MNVLKLAESIRSEFLDVIPSLSESEFRVLMNANDSEIKSKATIRYDEIHGVTMIKLKSSIKFKKLLKALFIEGVLSEEDLERLLTLKSISLTRNWNGKLIQLSISRGVVIKAPIELLEKVKV